MADKDTPSEALDKIVKQSKDILEQEVHSLFSKLTSLDVVDTGHFRISWRLYTHSDIKYRIRNKALYSDVLARGRRQFKNQYGNLQYYGSKEWYRGLSPMLKYSNDRLNKRYSEIKE